MTYTVAFDVATAGSREWESVQIGLLLTGIGVALILFPGLTRLRMRTTRIVFSWSFLLFALSLTIIQGWTGLSRHLDLREASIAGECAIVTGVVTDFVPMPYAGHANESFSVDGVRFEYSDYALTGGFNQSRSHGGPIREGLPVRICYVTRKTYGNVIVRLEVASGALDNQS